MALTIEYQSGYQNVVEEYIKLQSHRDIMELITPFWKSLGKAICSLGLTGTLKRAYEIISDLPGPPEPVWAGAELNPDQEKIVPLSTYAILDLSRKIQDRRRSHALNLTPFTTHFSIGKKLFTPCLFAIYTKGDSAHQEEVQVKYYSCGTWLTVDGSGTLELQDNSSSGPIKQFFGSAQEVRHSLATLSTSVLWREFFGPPERASGPRLSFVYIPSWSGNTLGVWALHCDLAPESRSIVTEGQVEGLLGPVREFYDALLGNIALIEPTHQRRMACVDSCRRSRGLISLKERSERGDLTEADLNAKLDRTVYHELPSDPIRQARHILRIAEYYYLARQAVEHDLKSVLERVPGADRVRDALEYLACGFLLHDYAAVVAELCWKEGLQKARAVLTDIRPESLSSLSENTSQAPAPTDMAERAHHIFRTALRLVAASPSIERRTLWYVFRYILDDHLSTARWTEEDRAILSMVDGFSHESDINAAEH